MSSDAKCGVRVQEGGEGGRAVTCEQNQTEYSSWSCEVGLCNFGA